MKKPKWRSSGPFSLSPEFLPAHTQEEIDEMIKYIVDKVRADPILMTELAQDWLDRKRGLIL